MKTSILKIIAGFVFICLLAGLAPALLKDTSLASVNLGPFSMRHNFYFGKRQWLADARTVVAAVQYLYQVRSSSSADPLDVISNPPALPVQRGIDTNLLGIAGTESAMRIHERRRPRAESLIVCKRLLTSYGLPASEWEAESRVTTVKVRVLLFPVLPTNAAPPGSRNFPCEVRVRSLQGV